MCYEPESGWSDVGEAIRQREKGSPGGSRKGSSFWGTEVRPVTVGTVVTFEIRWDLGCLKV